MIKKSFRLMLLGAFALLSSVFVACDKYDDDIKGLQEQIDALKAQVSSIQSEVSAGAVITGVAENADGITVTLSNGKSYKLTNGKDGKNGENGTDGKNGSVVEIGANGNWFIDGKDTGLAAEGKDGANGTNGSNGEDGKDADMVYYYPHESGVWYKVTVPADGSAKKEEPTTMSWLPADAGVLTAVFENGVLTLYNVEGGEGANGKVVVTGVAHLASLAVVPVDMNENMGMPVFTNYIIMKAAQFVASNDLEMTYRVNPVAADVEGAEFSFVNRIVKTKAFAGADKTNLLKFENYVASTAIEGAINVTAKVLVDPTTLVGAKEHNLFALKAVTADGCEVVSDYAELAAQELTELYLANVWSKPYPTATPKWHHLLKDHGNLAADDDHYDAEFKYTGSIDLDNIVRLAETDELNDFIDQYGFEVVYKFTKLQEYIGADGRTNQNKFVVIDEENVVSVDKSWLAQGTASVGRTPVFKAEAYIHNTQKDKDILIDAQYIKLHITKDEPTIEPIGIDPVVVGPTQYEYSDLVKADLQVDANGLTYIANEKTATVQWLPWEQANTQMYEALEMTPEVFWSIYDKYEVKNPATRPAGVEEYWGRYVAADNTTTDAVFIYFDPEKVKLGEGSITLILKSNTPKAFKDIEVEFKYNITHTQNFPPLNSNYILNGVSTTIVDNVYGGQYETVGVKGKLNNTKQRWSLESEMREFMFDYLQDYPACLPGNHTQVEFAIVGMVDKDDKLVTNNHGAALSTNDINAEISLDTPLAANEDTRTYLVKFIQRRANGGACEKLFCVQFIRPFDLSVNDITLKTYVAQPDNADIADYVVIKDKDGKVLYENKTITQYAIDNYKFTQAEFDAGFKYALPDDLDANDFGNTGNEKLTLAGSVLTWYNGGGNLQNNLSTNVVVTFTIADLAADEEKGNVTVLSTANSK